MGKKFLEGVVFGTGFAIAFIALAWLGVSLLTSAHVSQGDSTVSFGTSRQPSTPVGAESGPPFHELPLEEQIKRASVIALARYEPAPDGRKRAILKEFLKKDPETTIYYKIGDEFTSASFYPAEGSERGDGLVIFFVGSPATMRMSMTFFGDRIPSLGDIPLELFRNKCKDNA